MPMNLADFRNALADCPNAGVRFVVDGGRALADHFHVTEVGRVEKRFVDCGGKRRSAVACVLQTLVAGDTDHRLSTTKLAKILQLADSLALPSDAPVEVEHQERSISVDAVEGCELIDGVLTFRLAPKQTACLAEDVCGLPVLSGDGGDGCGEAGCC